MSTAHTTNPVNLGQLAEELDGKNLSSITTDDGCTITCHDPGLTNAALQAAVDAHTPADPPPTTDSLLQAQIDELTDLLLELI